MKTVLFICLLLSNGFLFASVKPGFINKIKSRDIITISNPTGEDLCEDFLKLVNLAVANKLNTLKGEAFTSKYSNSNELHETSIGIHGGLESFIGTDDEYECFYKSYDDEATATTAFAAIVKELGGCLKTKKVTNPDPLTTYIFYKKCRVKFHAYDHADQGGWLINITIEYDKYL